MLPVRLTAIRQFARRNETRLLLLVALAQGLLYLALLPPWQHYDEPTHFEYARLLAAGDLFEPVAGSNAVLQRELAASMVEHRFYWNLPQPELLTDTHNPGVGSPQLQDPPAYYVLVSLPLRLVRHLDLTSQLYVARAVSLLLFVLTVMIAARICADLLPPGHLLRWAVPLALALLPPFVDVMTSVNNEVGAVFSSSLFLWGSVRTLRFGLTWRRLLWISGAALLAALTKSTTLAIILLLPLVLITAIWARQRWPWRWYCAILGSLLLLSLALLFDWSAPAHWYDLSSGGAVARLSDPAAPSGQYVLQLSSAGRTSPALVVVPLTTADSNQLAGREVTAGAWLWASRPVRLSALRLVYESVDGRQQQIARPLEIGTTPIFVAWSAELPAEARSLQLRLSTGGGNADTSEPLQLFLDGAILVAGSFPASEPPQFDDGSGRSGSWAGQRFINLVPNASIEQSWPRLRPWFDRMATEYLYHPPSNLLFALLDLERTGPVLYHSFRRVLMTFFVVFAWGHIQIPGSLWFSLLQALIAISLAGMVVWLARRRARLPQSLWPSLILLGLAVFLSWGSTIARVLPALELNPYLPVARYTFPAIIPGLLMLVGGWWALWPRRLRTPAALLLLAGLFVLNLLAIHTIWTFYRSIPA